MKNAKWFDEMSLKQMPMNIELMMKMLCEYLMSIIERLQEKCKTTPRRVPPYAKCIDI